MLDCFRTGGANSPETFVTAVAATLARYPDQVIYEVTDPRSGMPAQLTWMPTIKDVHDFCERALLPIRSQEAREKRIAEQMEARRIQDEERAKPRASYAELKVKHGDNWGIGSEQSAPIDPAIAQRANQRRERAILDEYAALGIEPQYSSMGDLISPSLARQIAGTRELAHHIDNGFSPSTTGLKPLS